MKSLVIFKIYLALLNLHLAVLDFALYILSIIKN